MIKNIITGLALVFAIHAGAQETPERTVLIDNGLQKYVFNYFTVMNEHTDINAILSRGNVFIVFDVSINENLNSMEHTPAGVALGMNKDDLVYVVINAKSWLGLTDYQKQDLINHELSHDMFNATHVHDDEDDLMHPSSYPNNWGDTINRINKFTNNLKQ